MSALAQDCCIWMADIRGADARPKNLNTQVYPGNHQPISRRRKVPAFCFGTGSMFRQQNLHWEGAGRAEEGDP